MELKTYQKQVIKDLSEYFVNLQKYKQADTAYNKYWENKAGQYNPINGEGMRPYLHTVPNAIHLSIKVPTAGGKTFIACNALKTIFDAMPINKIKAVVWLVPWSNLLDQTVKNLSDPDHPYCQKLNALFNNKVQVYQKNELLQGAGFNQSSVREQLSIMVMNFASIRAKNKDSRKINEQNSNLANFSDLVNEIDVLEGTEKEALINVIRSLNPVLIVDESHNAESDLSVEMLNNLNPSFILDLTATPKQNANLISLVSAVELKKEHMVKLPVIVYNHQSIEGVIESAIHLQKKLEDQAIVLEANGGKYIRPIVLFQAQSKLKEDSTTFEKLKLQLINFGIPSDQIKIKTASKDELKGVNLMSRDCSVRYIITINALKEGWDCPFAYILASLADRSSEVDVTQILGRILRQPYVMKHSSTMLNLAYVITASIKFQDTLQNIIKGLQQSGFSEKDYREKDMMTDSVKKEMYQDALDQYFAADHQKSDDDQLIKFQEYAFDFNYKELNNKAIQEIEAMAITQNEKFAKEIESQMQNSSTANMFAEVGIKVKQYRMRELVKEQAQELLLPKFVIETPSNEVLLMDEGGTQLLDRVNLLKNFKLFDKDIQIHFNGHSSDLYKVDTEETSAGEYKMSSFKIENSMVQEQITELILAKPKEGQVKDLAYFVFKQIDNMPPIAESEIKKYIYRILENMSSQDLIDFNRFKFSYSDLIKKKINQLADLSAEETFKDWIQINKIRTAPVWKFKDAIVPPRIGSDYANSLYAHEGEMNGLEETFIREISNSENLSFWHRNLGRGKGFSLNGFKSNHYPDFILVTKTNKVIIVETKGADRDNSDSAGKLRLGLAWEKLSGPNYKYIMVFDKNAIEGAYNIEKAIAMIKLM